MQKLPLAVYSVEQIRLLERMAIDDAGICGFSLMSLAGAASVVCIQQKFPQAQRFVVFCGNGNNAGDGFIVARLLQNFATELTVYTLHDPNALKGDALTAYQKLHESGGQVQLYQGLTVPDCDLIIDALLGTGISRAVTGLYLTAIEQINASQIPVLSVDMPSGLHADTGKALPIAVKANCTLTFIGLKQGLFSGDAAEFRGELLLDNLGLPETLFARVTPSVQRVGYLPLPKRHRCAHKGKNGHVLIVGGDLGYSGAVCLAGEAALRVGSGLVSIATRAEHAIFLNSQRPELMCHAINDITQLEGLLAKATVVVIGPGLGQSAWAKALLNTVLKQQKPIVIDADGLNLLATIDTSGCKTSAWILTPHPGEAARLLSCSTQAIEQDRFATIRALQQKYAATIVLKGAGTLIADEVGVSVVTDGNPGMATGGMGDVLSGVIAGLVAQGLSISTATQQGVLIHAMAADQSALLSGERGLLASDLMPYLRKLVN